MTKVCDDAGNELDASFEVAPGTPPTVVFMSRGGGRADGVPRNPDYDEGLRVILQRLGSIDAVLLDAFVDSRVTRKLNLSEDARRIPIREFDYPLNLATVDPGVLRRSLARGQAGVAREPDAKPGGNPHKQIRLVLRLPDSAPSDHRRLERFLASGELESRYFAILVNYNVYDVEGAASVLDEDTWSMPKGHLEPGDRVVFWRTLGPDGHRGVVAFGEVLSSPEVEPELPQAAPFWRGERPTEAVRRFRVRYAIPPRLPLWLDQDHTGLLASLSVAGGQGTKLYQVSEDQWRELLTLAGGWPEEGSREAEEAAVIAAAAVTKRRSGQGYSSDPLRNRAVELRAMAVVEAVLREENWDVQNTSESKPYDLFCTRGNERLYVEVKGTTSDGEAVHLTAGEVEHVRAHPGQCALYVVAGIVVSGSPPTADAGTLRLVHRPWDVDAGGELKAVAYRYDLAVALRSTQAAPVRS